MSDDKIETGGGEPAKPAETSRNTSRKPVNGDHDTDTNLPEVEGGQPAVGDDLPRNTEL